MLKEYTKIVDNIIELDPNKFSDGEIIDIITALNVKIADWNSLLEAVQYIAWNALSININDLVDEEFIKNHTRKYETPLDFFKSWDYFTIKEWEQSVASWWFTDYDWSWNRVKDGMVSLEWPFETTKEDATGVIRFNK